MRSFEHAAASRNVAEAVVVRVEFDDGSAGFGETLPREYVTGETIDSVIADLGELYWPALAGQSFDRLEDLSKIRAVTAEKRCTNAAACAVELAFMDRLWPAEKGAKISSRVSGVLGSGNPDKTARRLRLMWLFGLRDFKLKLGIDPDTDHENLKLVGAKLESAIAAGKATLRVDVNGGWDADTTPERISELLQYGVSLVEQPIYCSAQELVELARRCELPLMADESLLTADDAQTLLTEPKRIWWNIRISKNGGLGAAMELSRLAASGGVNFTAGCMVGESGLLSAAQRRLLQAGPCPRFVEGNYGSFLLGGDIIDRPIRFGLGGRLKVLPGPGLGVTVSPAKLARWGKLVRQYK